MIYISQPPRASCAPSPKASRIPSLAHRLLPSSAPLAEDLTTWPRAMSSSEHRPILPHSLVNEMSSFSFAPPNMGIGDAKKSTSRSCAQSASWLTPAADYVFVDEHNRHKRLKGASRCSGGRSGGLTCGQL